MNTKKIIAFVILLTICCSNFIFNVKADSVTVNSTSPGVVGCVVDLTCADSSDVIKIYYSETSPVTTSDDATYVDPSDLVGASGRTNRKILIRGLSEETLYYYRVYSTKDAGWSVAESSFTTLPRYTTEWQDEFMDFYLIEASNEVDIVQQNGIKRGSSMPVGTNPIVHDNGTLTYNAGGWGYVSVVKNATGQWFMWIQGYNAAYNGEALWFYTSTDGINWQAPDSGSVLDIGLSGTNHRYGTAFWNKYRRINKFCWSCRSLHKRL